jgi:hypothetical protein
MKKSPYALAFLVIILLVGCNLPGNPPTQSSPDAAFTQAAETVAAELTRVALQASPTSELPTATFTPSPTNTTVYTPTYTPVPCNLAQFVSDVTVPDYTEMDPDQDFQKIWRLRNIGSCTWTTSYRVTFDTNNSMGLATDYAKNLSSPVPPGQTVDIIVDLTAPIVNGTYRGDYSLRDPNNVKITNFIVIIKVNAPSHTTTLSPVSGEGGTVRSDGAINLDSYFVGDTSGDLIYQSFISYDISGIPSTANITEVKVDPTGGGKTYSGNPFDLGCMRLYPQDFGALDAGDFFTGSLGSPYVEWCSQSSLEGTQVDGDLKNLIQSKLGSTRVRIRLQFTTGTNSDGISQSVKLDSPKLIVTYTAP